MSWQVGFPGSHYPDKWHTLLALPISLNPVSHPKSTFEPYFVPFVTDTVPLAGALGSLPSTKTANLFIKVHLIVKYMVFNWSLNISLTYTF